MKMKKIWRKCQRDRNSIQTERILQDLHRAFSKSVIKLIVKSSKSPHINKTCIGEIILLLPEYL